MTSSRVKPWRIRRLYMLDRQGICDDELLLEVGWGLFARAQDVLAFHRALRGEVTCDKCRSIVHRSIRSRQLQTREVEEARTWRFPCPSCGRSTSWPDCASPLTKTPRCLRCWDPLQWHYATNTLSCARCNREWKWNVYSKSPKRQTRLPCPHCGDIIRRPKRDRPKPIQATSEGESSELTCPRCGRPGARCDGSFKCADCGYERPWRAFSKMLRRKDEHLECGECGHSFTWHTWRQDHSDANIRTGNTAGIRAFVSQWKTAKTPQAQMIEIDNILHAIHGRGAMAAVFIEGNQQTATELLDELAGYNSTTAK